MLAVIMMVFLSKGIAQINVALNKKSTYCGGNEVYNDLTDGNKKLDGSVRITTKCGEEWYEHSYIDIDLEELFYVHYVVVTEGKRSKGLEEALDFFIVELYKGTDFEELKLEDMSVFIFQSLGEGMEMRVNCHGKLTRKVRINSRGRDGFSIAEIEVFTLGVRGPEKGTSYYYGCFDTFDTIKSVLFEDWGSCLDFCVEQQFAAIRNGTDCHCGFLKDVRPKEPEHCNIICGNQYCGGDRYFSTYLVQVHLLVYIGCLTGRSDEEFLRLDATAEICINYCLRISTYPTMSLSQNGCSCYRLSGAPLQESRHCSKCLDSNQYCGEADSSSTAKYLLPSYFFDHRPTTNLYPCDGDMDLYGNCLECQRFMEGSSYCFGRMLDVKPNCEVYNPCAYLVDKICDDSKGVYECVCLPGYITNNKTKECEDINECATGEVICPERMSECANLNGSFECKCHPGFKKVAGLLCAIEAGTPSKKFSIGWLTVFFLGLILLGAVFVYFWLFHQGKHSTQESHGSSNA